MARKTERNIINAIDVGTSKALAVIAAADEQHELDVLGVGVADTEGMRKGMVTDIDRVARSIYRAVSAAEKMAQHAVEAAYISVTGAHLTTNTAHGVTSVMNPHSITAEDTQRAVESTRGLRLPPDKEIIDIFEQEYAVDGHEGIREPVGMSGSRLDVQVQILTGASAPIHNLVKCLARLDISVLGLIPSAMASGEAALNDDEKEIGVVLMDIGGGATDVALYKRGAMAHAFVIPVGGDHIDNDIAIGLSTSIGEARRIKLKYGNADPQADHDAQPVEMRLVGREETSQVPQSILTEIIHPRVEEIFELALKQLEEKEPMVAIPAGVVLTGGVAHLPGLARVAGDVMRTHIRVGAPRGVRSNHEKVSGPEHATAVGVARCAALRHIAPAEPPVSLWQRAASLVQRAARGIFKEYNPGR